MQPIINLYDLGVKQDFINLSTRMQSFNVCDLSNVIFTRTVENAQGCFNYNYDSMIYIAIHIYRLYQSALQQFYARIPEDTKQ